MHLKLKNELGEVTIPIDKILDLYLEVISDSFEIALAGLNEFSVGGDLNFLEQRTKELSRISHEYEILKRSVVDPPIGGINITLE